MSDLKKLLILVVVLAGFGLFTVSKSFIITENLIIEDKPVQNPVSPQKRLVIGDTPLRVEVRQTEQEQALGLSWRKSLGDDEGMLFAYPAPRKVLFWMKDMLFPLDIIWISGDKVVEVTENIPHPTKEAPVVRTFVPQQPVDGVVEVNAGFVSQHAIKVGDTLRFEN